MRGLTHQVLQKRIEELKKLSSDDARFGITQSYLYGFIAALLSEQIIDEAKHNALIDQVKSIVAN